MELLGKDAGTRSVSLAIKPRAMARSLQNVNNFSYIYIFNSYRAVNILSLGYEHQPVKAVK